MKSMRNGVAVSDILTVRVSLEFDIPLTGSCYDCPLYVEHGNHYTDSYYSEWCARFQVSLEDMKPVDECENPNG